MTDLQKTWYFECQDPISSKWAQAWSNKFPACTDEAEALDAIARFQVEINNYLRSRAGRQPSERWDANAFRVRIEVVATAVVLEAAADANDPLTWVLKEPGL